MVLGNKNSINKTFPIVIGVAIIGSYIVQLVAASFLIYFLLINVTKDSLITTSKRIAGDIKYNNGKWDLSYYNSDPDISGTFPLYIIATDGFIIDRSDTINGFLDKSRISLLNNYLVPQTIHTADNESWRIYSKPIVSNGKNIGMTTVSVFNPDSDDLRKVDGELENTANLINSKIYIKNGRMVISNVDNRKINYAITFEIVDQFNSVLLKSSNISSIDSMPDHIDRSYVGYDLSLPSFIQIKDSISNELFLVYNSTIRDKYNNIIGIIASGSPIGYIYQTIWNFVYIESVFGIILTILLIRFIYVYTKNNFRKLLEQNEIELHVVKMPSKISFLKKESKLLINDTSVSIPYATNQYYFCEAIFSNPSKRWEADELLEKFGEHDLTQWHKVYDAMKTMNKRVIELLPDKLFILKNKTYQINPDFHKIIS